MAIQTRALSLLSAISYYFPPLLVLLEEVGLGGCYYPGPREVCTSFVQVPTCRNLPPCRLQRDNSPFQRSSLMVRSKWCEAEMASNIAAIVNRFPLRELETRRRCARDPNFVEVCEHYGEALQALRHWEGAGPAGAARAEEYRQILEELEAEMLAILDRPPAP